MPDMQIDRIIWLAEANQSRLSIILSKEIPIFEESRGIVQAIEISFKKGSKGGADNKYVPKNPRWSKEIDVQRSEQENQYLERRCLLGSIWFMALLFLAVIFR